MGRQQERCAIVGRVRNRRREVTGLFRKRVQPHRPNDTEFCRRRRNVLRTTRAILGPTLTIPGGITALTGDVTASGLGSQAATLANTASDTGELYQQQV